MVNLLAVRSVCRHKHGGYFTTEYGSGLPNAEHPWEENRGMAHSFGYSRSENLEDYNTSQEFVYMLIDIVSRGGNFLLDIGPTGDDVEISVPPRNPSRVPCRFAWTFRIQR